MGKRILSVKSAKGGFLKKRIWMGKKQIPQQHGNSGYCFLYFWISWFVGTQHRVVWKVCFEQAGWSYHRKKNFNNQSPTNPWESACSEGDRMTWCDFWHSSSRSTPTWARPGLHHLLHQNFLKGKISSLSLFPLFTMQQVILKDINFKMWGLLLVPLEKKYNSQDGEIVPNLNMSHAPC